MPKEILELLQCPIPCPQYCGLGEPLGKPIQRQLTLLNVFIPRGRLHSRAVAFLILLPLSLPSDEQRPTNGCHELHISCPFPFASQQAGKARQALSLKGLAGFSPLSCHMAVVASSLFPFPLASRALLSSHTWKGKRGSICQSQSA